MHTFKGPYTCTCIRDRTRMHARVKETARVYMHIYKRHRKRFARRRIRTVSLSGVPGIVNLFEIPLMGEEGTS